MRVARAALLALGGVGLVACGGGGEGAEGAERGYVLLDAAAREAGYLLEVAGERVRAVLPIALAEGGDAELVGPSGQVALVAAEGELLSIEGGDAELVTRGIADELDDGVLYVDAPAAAAQALADALGATLSGREDGRFEIRGEELIEAAALLEADVAADLRAVTPALRERLAGAEPAASRAPRQARAAKAAPARPGGVAAFDLVAVSARLEASILQAVDGVLDRRGVGPAVSCKDPVAGTWVSQIYDGRYREWYVFTLQIAHAGGGRLAGRIGAHFWQGDDEAVRAPQSCDDDDEAHFLVGMTAAGTLIGGELRFGGTSHRIERHLCGQDGGYNLDQFSGKLDGSHFLAVNNDGGKAIDQPTPFRRVSCK